MMYFVNRNVLDVAWSVPELYGAPEVLGEVVVPGVAVKLSATPGDIRRLGPELGEHNREIYEGLLGLAADELTRLRDAGVI